MIATDTIPVADEAAVRSLVGSIPDPEIPVLTLADLGVVRHVAVDGDGVTVGIAPTYTACPATEVIEASVRSVLEEQGWSRITVERVMSPPWTTDWIGADGRRKLKRYGIAPPPAAGRSKRALLSGDHPVACPRCNSAATTRVSEYGSTPCKASYKCDDCLEPFEYFKCI